MLDWSLITVFSEGMPHAHCIRSGYLVALLVIADLGIGLGYFGFAWVNRRIMKTNAGSGYFATEKTFRRFAFVFVTCGIKSLMLAYTMYQGYYLPLAVITLWNLYAIAVALKSYYEQLPFFTAAPFPKDVVEMNEHELKTEIMKLRLEQARLLLK